MSKSNQAKRLADFVPKEGSKYAMDWDDYHDHNTLNDFIAALADANDFASIIPIGESYEGRKMNVLAITKAGPGAPNIWLEAGIHAREWISPAVATFIIRELVEDYAEHPSHIDNINWYFLPSGIVGLFGAGLAEQYSVNISVLFFHPQPTLTGTSTQSTRTVTGGRTGHPTLEAAAMELV